MSLRSFLEEMEKTREIVYVREEVSPRFEIPSITKAFEGEPVLFFDKVKDYETKIVVNLYETRGMHVYSFCVAWRHANELAESLQIILIPVFSLSEWL